MEREYVLAGFTLAGIVFGAFFTGLFGYLKARREGVTGTTVAAMGNLAAFYEESIERLREAEKRADEAAQSERRLIRENADLQRQVDDLKAAHAELAARMHSKEG